MWCSRVDAGQNSHVVFAVTVRLGNAVRLIPKGFPSAASVASVAAKDPGERVVPFSVMIEPWRGTGRRVRRAGNLPGESALGWTSVA